MLIECAVLSLSTVLAYRTDIPLLAGSLSTASAAVYCSGFHLPAAFSPAGRSFLTTNHTSPQKKLKVHYFCNNSYVSFLFFLLQSLISRCRMSKPSTTTAPKNPTPLPAKSAWARGPPQSSSTAPSPRSQSPAPSTPVLQSHSRRPSALGQGIPIKDGVSIPRNNVGAVKQGLSVLILFSAC